MKADPPVVTRKVHPRPPKRETVYYFQCPYCRGDAQAIDGEEVGAAHTHPLCRQFEEMTEDAFLKHAQRCRDLPYNWPDCYIPATPKRYKKHWLEDEPA